MSQEVYDRDFYQALSEGSLRSARVVVPKILELVPATSVLDVGSGTGAWLSVFSEMGVEKIQGIDGPWVNPEGLRIPAKSFQSVDLTGDWPELPRFDLVTTFEVAEHLDASFAEAFVRKLTALSDVVVFSAAIPEQGGDHHVNERWPEYWVEIFRAQGFLVYDPFRDAIWEEKEVEWWYAQNLLLFAKDGRDLGIEPVPSGHSLKRVHPGNYLSKVRIVKRYRNSRLHRWVDTIQKLLGR